MPTTRQLLVIAIFVVTAAACGESEPAGQAAANANPSTTASQIDADDRADSDVGAGIRLIGAEQGAALQADPPADLVILDVRTPEEFADGHLEGAVMLDFHEPDFADRLADLDPDVPYLLYCRSGNRSGQTAALMKELGFVDVADVDGGIIAWGAAGHPLVTG